MKIIKEQHGIFEYLGGYFITPDEAELLKQKYPTIEFEDSEAEKTINIAPRRVIGTKSIGSQPYLIGTNNLEDLNFNGTRLVSDREDAVYPNPEKCYLKKVITESLVDESNLPNCIIFSEKDNCYFYVSNQELEVLNMYGDVMEVNAKDLPYPIKIILMEVPYNFTIVSNDISAQEPMQFSLLSREKNWLKVFELKNFKMDEHSLIYFMEEAISEHFKVAKDESKVVWFFHDSFKDRTFIYQFNSELFKLKLDRPNNFEQKLEELYQMFESYTPKY